MDKTSLVTGASGFVGTFLCSDMNRRGWTVRAATRRPMEAATYDSLPVIVGEINGETNWTDSLTGVDVIFHLAARVHVMRETSTSPQEAFDRVNLHGTVNLARQAAHAGVKRFVYVSTIGVNGLSTTVTHPFTEEDKPHPHNAYALSKWKAEKELSKIASESTLEIVIVRPPLVYGPGVPGNFEKMLSFVARGIPLPLGSTKNLRSLIYVGNLADALISCAYQPAAAGKTYLVSDGEDISTTNLVLRLAELLGSQSRLFPCPPGLLKFIGTITGKQRQINQLLGSLRVDGSKLSQELQWIPPYTMQQGLQATADWYKALHS